MNVALTFPGCHRRGGVERVVYECAGFLAGRGHRVTVFAQDWEQGDVARGVRYQRVPARRRPGFLHGNRFFRNCSRAVAQARPDVLNAHGVICPTGGVHWVHSVHRAWLERCREFRPPFSFGRLRQRLNPLHPLLLRLEEEHFRARRYRKVLALTEAVKADLGRLYDVPAADVTVISNGFSPTEFNPERRAERRAAMRSRLGLRENEVALLFVANELARKGYATILDAMRSLKSDRLRLLVVGRVPSEKVLREARRCGVGDRVTACGPTGDVSAFHAAADLFVLPTQYEAFCLSILEALGSGMPVITTRVPGAGDAIQPGVNGYLMDDPRSGEQLREKLLRLLDDDHRALLSRQAPATVVGYQWPAVLTRYEQVLQSCA